MRMPLRCPYCGQYPVIKIIREKEVAMCCTECGFLPEVWASRRVFVARIRWNKATKKEWKLIEDKALRAWFNSFSSKTAARQSNEEGIKHDQR